MHLAQRLAAIVLTLGLSAGLVGCGFHLKGSYPTATPLVYNKRESSQHLSQCYGRTTQ